MRSRILVSMLLSAHENPAPYRFAGGGADRAKPSTAARHLCHRESSHGCNSDASLPRAEDPGSWRYRAGKGAPKVPVLALIVATSIHSIALFGFNDPKVAEVVDDGLLELEVVFLEMPPMEELDEPEEIFDGDAVKEEIDPGQYVPMQADIPTFNTEAVFVQQMDMKSLLPAPEFDSAVLSIPKRISHSRVPPSTLKNVFNLADLDRIPEPIFQPAPGFPRHLTHEVMLAEVLVEFIVDAKGKVVWDKVVSATHHGFEDAAILGVSRWQFRAGMKNGKRVITRRQVPRRFRVDGD